MSEYIGVSVTGDAIVTARVETRSGLWLADAAGKGSRQIGADILSRFDDDAVLAWAADTHLIYAATAAGGSGLWSTDVNGGPAQLIANAGFWPTTSADGRTLLFVRARDGGYELWRADGNGMDATHVTVLDREFYSPHALPDGSAVTYLSLRSGQQVVLVLNLVDAKSWQLSSLFAWSQQVAPDGRLVAFLSEDKNGAVEAVVVPIDGGKPLHRMTPSRGVRGPMRWTPDGRGLGYIDNGSKKNIWVQPLDGQPPYQLTHFTDSPWTVDFAWSVDGKRLAIAREVKTSDIVMLKGIQ